MTLPCLSHRRAHLRPDTLKPSAAFCSPQGWEEAVISGREKCRQDTEGCRRNVGVTLSHRGLPPTWVPGQRPWSSWVRKAGKHQTGMCQTARSQTLLLPLPTCPEPVWRLYSRAAAGDVELGETAPSRDVSIRALSVSISWNQEPKPPAWNFTGFNIKFFSVVQSLSDIRTSLFWEQFRWKRPGVFNSLTFSISQKNLCH